MAKLLIAGWRLREQRVPRQGEEIRVRGEQKLRLVPQAWLDAAEKRLIEAMGTFARKTRIQGGRRRVPATHGGGQQLLVDDEALELRFVDAFDVKCPGIGGDAGRHQTGAAGPEVQHHASLGRSSR